MVNSIKWDVLGINGTFAASVDILRSIGTNSFGSENVLRTWAIIIAGICVVTALGLSLFLIFEHLSAYKNPEEQKFLIGVILMVPVYGVESLVSLVKPAVNVDCEILRDCYEAFAMYCFGRYLIACLGGCVCSFLSCDAGILLSIPGISTFSIKRQHLKERGGFLESQLQKCFENSRIYYWQEKVKIIWENSLQQP